MFKSEPYYWIVCDGEGCTANAQEDGDFSAWKEPDGALAEAESSGWVEKDDKHFCPDHAPAEADDEADDEQAVA